MKHLAGFILLFPIAFAGFAKADTNVALAPGAGGTNAGVALFGYDSGAITAPGTEYDHAGSSVYLNDGVTNGNNGDDSWPYGSDYYGFVGATFTLSPSTQVDEVVLYGRDFGDGGWFGVHGLNPQGAGSTLTAANLIAPTLQYTTNGGLSWVTDTNVSNDYVTALTGAYAGGGAPTNAATFNLSLPLTGVDGIRLIGSMGGPTGDGFLGADEIEVLAGPVPEPSTWVLLFGGVAILAVVIRRRAVRA